MIYLGVDVVGGSYALVMLGRYLSVIVSVEVGQNVMRCGTSYRLYAGILLPCRSPTIPMTSNSHRPP